MRQLLLSFLSLFLASACLLGQNPCADDNVTYSNYQTFISNFRPNNPEVTVLTSIRECIIVDNSDQAGIAISDVQGEGAVLGAKVYFRDQIDPFVTLELGDAAGGQLDFFQDTFGVELKFLSVGSFTVEVEGPGSSDFARTVSIVAGTAAPVTWTKNLEFRPFGEQLELYWSVTDQIDVAGYELEKMDGGPGNAGFSKVADIGFKESSTAEVNYSVHTSWPVSGAYYRIKQLDFAGTYDYSNVVFVQGNDGSVQQFKMFPNPATNFVRMSVPENIRSVDLITASGRLVRSYTAAEVNREGMDVSQVSAGVYLVRPVSAEGPTKTQRLVVNH